jgi:phosphoadenosine phosphosulfate reductase
MKNPRSSGKILSDKVDRAVSLLRQVVTDFSPAAFASSFGAEDMVLLDLIASHAREIEVFTLDTGRLPDETYALMSRVRERYPVVVRVYVPQTENLESYIERNGPNAFYQSVAQRKECCHIRKVEPLGRALEGKRAWVTGLRREQSATREKLDLHTWDDANGLEKFSPLLEWSADEVWTYVLSNDVPYNELHDQGYPSIGCAPCTRAVDPGDEVRSGRWWWESSNSKECGLHPVQS